MMGAIATGMTRARLSVSRGLDSVARVLAVVAPSHGQVQLNTGDNHRRSLDGASPAGRTSGYGMSGQVNAEIAAGRETINRRAEYLAINYSYCTNAVQNVKAFVVGTGPRPNARGILKDPRRYVHHTYDHFIETADYDGRTDLNGLFDLVVRDMIVKGEALVLLHDTPDGLRIQVIPPEHLDASKTGTRDDGSYIVEGVEFNASGQRVAYWIFPQKPNSIYADYAPARRVDATHVLHVFVPITAGQVRGLSWFAPAILPANELDQYMDALLTGAKMSVMLAGFITDATDTGDDNDESFDNIQFEPGTLTRLPLGKDIKFSAPDQIKDAPALLRINLQTLAAALGVPEFLLSGDLTGANYSSLRAGLIPFRARVEQIQNNTLVPQLLRPIWRRWLALEIVAGRLDAPADLACDWIWPRPQQVDPAKDLEATEKALALGLISRTQAINERGFNADDIDEEIKADRDREAELGLTFAAAKKEGENAA